MIIGGIYRGLLPVERIYQGKTLIWGFVAQEREFAAGAAPTIVIHAALTQDEARALGIQAGFGVEVRADAILGTCAVVGAKENILMLVSAQLEQGMSEPVVPKMGVELGTAANGAAAASAPVAPMVGMELGTAADGIAAVSAPVRAGLEADLWSEADLKGVTVQPVAVREQMILSHEAEARLVESIPVTASALLGLLQECDLVGSEAVPHGVRAVIGLLQEGQVRDSVSAPTRPRAVVGMVTEAAVGDTAEQAVTVPAWAELDTVAEATAAVPDPLSARCGAELATTAAPAAPDVAALRGRLDARMETRAELSDNKMEYTSLNAGIAMESEPELLAGVPEPVTAKTGSAALQTQAQAEDTAAELVSGQCDMAMETEPELMEGASAPGRASAQFGITHRAEPVAGVPRETPAQARVELGTQAGIRDSPGVPGAPCGRIDLGARGDLSIAAPESVNAGTHISITSEAALCDDRARAFHGRVSMAVGTRAAAELWGTGAAKARTGAQLCTTATLNTWAPPVRRGTDLLILQAARTEQTGKNLTIF